MVNGITHVGPHFNRVTKKQAEMLRLDGELPRDQVFLEALGKPWFGATHTMCPVQGIFRRPVEIPIKYATIRSLQHNVCSQDCHLHCAQLSR